MAESKELIPIKDEQYPVYTVGLSGGGPTPESLKGIYTSIAEAIKAIKAYQAKVRAKVRGTTKEPS